MQWRSRIDNATFMQYLEHHVITYKAQPARRHNKTGFVESGHSSIKLLARRLVLDSKSSTMHNRLPSFPELISHATFLRNHLYGSRILSSFEQARGYQHSIADLPVGIITPALLQAHAEQIARRTLSRLLKARHVNLLDHSVLKPGTAINVFTKIGKRIRWDPGFVVNAWPEYVGIRRQPGSSGAVLKIV
jgi:hypothetical protein